MLSLVPMIIGIYILTICVVFFSYFSTRIAKMKLRNAGWGIVGALLGPVGLILVCYLPSRRKDGKETNPIRAGFRALPGASRIVFLVLILLLAVALITMYLINSIPRWKENKRYEESVGTTVVEKLHYTEKVNGTPAALYAGSDSTYLVTDKGELYTWGYNALSLNADDEGKVLDDVKSVAQSGKAVYVLKTDGKLYKYQKNGKQTKIAESVSKVTATEHIAVYMTTDGSVYGLGSNVFGQLGDPVKADAKEPVKICGDAEDIALGLHHLMVLTDYGEVQVCGSNGAGAFGKPNVEGFSGFKVVASGCKAIAAGSDSSYILLKDGTLKSCGLNDACQLGREVENDNHKSFEQVAKDVESIGATGKTAWYIADGSLYTWGQNCFGQLGHGSLKDTSKPKKISDDVESVASSGHHLAVLCDGELFFCGDNTYGQLGKTGKVCNKLTKIVSVK